MVEFINKLTESQAADRVRKVLRSDPDKKRDQQPNEESEFDQSEDKEEKQDEVIIAGIGEKPTREESPTASPDGQELLKSQIKDETEEDRPEDGHIDLTA